ncbi:MAG: endonuclease [Litoreibacter sp.]|nr:endonuclease [Litoreibacter sp.]
MRIATYNVEWFSNLFDDQGELIEDESWSARHNVTKAMQITALGSVFQALDADAIMVIEAPDSSRGRDGTTALETFAERFALRASKVLIGYTNHTQQEIMLLYDPDVISAIHDPIGDPRDAHAPRFDGTYRIDLDIDAKADRVTFSKPPLEVAVQTKAGQLLRMIGVHAKSKAPHSARNSQDMMRIAIANRRKQLAQCIWLRHRVDQHLAARDPLIVLGDFNDGPGLDAYEKLFGRSSVEIVLGADLTTAEQLFDPHARSVLGQKLAAPFSSARFYLSTEKRFINALLDYIMVSPDLTAKSPKWRIWHPFDDPGCWRDPDLRTALLTASDHFPVTMDIAL